MIRTVFLDAGGVLVHPDWTRVAPILAAHGAPRAFEVLQRAELIAAREIDEHQVIRGTTDTSRVRRWFGRILALSDVAPDDALIDAMVEVHRRANLWTWLPEEVPAALVRLRDAGIGRVVVSNADGTIRRVLADLGVAALVDHVVDSGEEGVEKPDPALFLRALARSGADPATTAHVGDLYHVDVVGARAAGLQAALIDKAALHLDRDCPRFPSLTSFVDWVMTTV